MPLILNKCHAKKPRRFLLPFVVRPCNWEEYRIEVNGSLVYPLNETVMRPTDAKPLSSFDDNGQDEELSRFAKEVRDVVCGKAANGSSPIPTSARTSPDFEPAYYSGTDEQDRQWEMTDGDALLDEMLAYFRTRSVSTTRKEIYFARPQGEKRNIHEYLQSFLRQDLIHETPDSTVLFTERCRHSYPRLIASDINHTIASQFQALHVSTHFQVGRKSLVAPWTTCYTCFQPFDIVTNLASLKGLTAQLVNDGKSLVAGWESLPPSDDRPSISPIYRRHMTTLLAGCIHFRNRAVLIKIENRRKEANGVPFSDDDRDRLVSVLRELKEPLGELRKYMKTKYDKSRTREFIENHVVGAAYGLPTVRSMPSSEIIDTIRGTG